MIELLALLAATFLAFSGFARFLGKWCHRKHASSPQPAERIPPNPFTPKPDERQHI